jgi:hypothetical protein
MHVYPLDRPRRGVATDHETVPGRRYESVLGSGTGVREGSDVLLHAPTPGANDARRLLVRPAPSFVSERPFRPLEAGAEACSSYAEATYRKRRNASPDATYGRILHPPTAPTAAPPSAARSCCASSSAMRLVPVVDGGTSRCLPLSLPPPRMRLTTASDDNAARRPCYTRGCLEPSVQGVLLLWPES